MLLVVWQLLFIYSSPKRVFYECKTTDSYKESLTFKAFCLSLDDLPPGQNPSINLHTGDSPTEVSASCSSHDCRNVSTKTNSSEPCARNESSIHINPCFTRFLFIRGGYKVPSSVSQYSARPQWANSAVP